MARNQSQLYTVDERYKETQDAVDNNAGLDFLRRYTQRDQAGKRYNLEAQRQEDDRVFTAIPRANSNAYGIASYRNPFRAAQGDKENYISIKDSEKLDDFTSLGEQVSENIRSIYDKSATYIKNPREEFYSR